MPSEEVDTILARLEISKHGEWKDKDLQYIPYPATWLNGRRWEDEIEAPGDRWKGQAGALHGKPGKYSKVPTTESRNVN